uniref:Fibronectin type-III domain-containing protein n=1 Tax=Chromera velia CCMP2878 TaxID=1169474 RepID=A0A0G4HVQ1_9ALVE|eukprot:Cvel_8849.t1-p1 / transcript=Cvel_8849.t1 / gene=Cvel_8849 / organism=Chromera_velia_CCMP2878 / gene_product=hypothetical protein / transcript_product=hypothetical protein / location=Cvel_scaffold497:18435-50447(+) / protein_length=2170 / sequence_SO=supercontig / SO=protein_coding / is_pseudo=false
MPRRPWLLCTSFLLCVGNFAVRGADECVTGVDVNVKDDLPKMVEIDSTVNSTARFSFVPDPAGPEFIPIRVRPLAPEHDPDMQIYVQFDDENDKRCILLAHAKNFGGDVVNIPMQLLTTNKVGRVFIRTECPEAGSETCSYAVALEQDNTEAYTEIKCHAQASGEGEDSVTTSIECPSTSGVVFASNSTSTAQLNNTSIKYKFNCGEECGALLEGDDVQHRRVTFALYPDDRSLAGADDLVLLVNKKTPPSSTGGDSIRSMFGWNGGRVVTQKIEKETFYIWIYRRFPERSDVRANGVPFTLDVLLPNATITLTPDSNRAKYAALPEGGRAFFRVFINDTKDFDVILTPFQGDPDMAIAHADETKFPSPMKVQGKGWESHDFGADRVRITEGDPLRKAHPTGWYHIGVHAFSFCAFSLVVSKKGPRGPPFVKLDFESPQTLKISPNETAHLYYHPREQRGLILQTDIKSGPRPDVCFLNCGPDDSLFVTCKGLKSEGDAAAQAECPSSPDGLRLPRSSRAGFLPLSASVVKPFNYYGILVTNSENEDIRMQVAIRDESFPLEGGTMMGTGNLRLDVPFRGHLKKGGALVKSFVAISEMFSHSGSYTLKASLTVVSGSPQFAVYKKSEAQMMVVSDDSTGASANSTAGASGMDDDLGTLLFNSTREGSLVFSQSIKGPSSTSSSHSSADSGGDGEGEGETGWADSIFNFVFFTVNKGSEGVADFQIVVQLLNDNGESADEEAESSSKALSFRKAHAVSLQDGLTLQGTLNLMGEAGQSPADHFLFDVDFGEDPSRRREVQMVLTPLSPRLPALFASVALKSGENAFETGSRYTFPTESNYTWPKSTDPDQQAPRRLVTVSKDDPDALVKGTYGISVVPSAFNGQEEGPVRSVSYLLHVTARAMRMVMEGAPADDSVKANTFRRYRFATPQWNQTVVFSLTVRSGDADLFVGFDPSLTNKKGFEFSSTLYGSDVVFLAASDATRRAHCNETTVDENFECEFFVAVWGFKPSSFSLSVETRGGGAVGLQLGVPRENEMLQKQTSSFYKLEIDPTKEVEVNLKTIAGDPDLYVTLVSGKRIQEGGGAIGTIHNQLSEDGGTAVLKSFHAIGDEHVTATVEYLRDRAEKEQCGSAGQPACFLYVEVFGFTEDDNRFTLSASQEGVGGPMILTDGAPATLTIGHGKSKELSFEVGNSEDVEGVEVKAFRVSGGTGCVPSLIVRTAGKTETATYPDNSLFVETQEGGHGVQRLAIRVENVESQQSEDSVEASECRVSVSASVRAKSSAEIETGGEGEGRQPGQSAGEGGASDSLMRLDFGVPTRGTLHYKEGKDGQPVQQFFFAFSDTSKPATITVEALSGAVEAFISSGTKPSAPGPHKNDGQLQAVSAGVPSVLRLTVGGEEGTSTKVCESLSGAEKGNCQVRISVYRKGEESGSGGRARTEFSIVVSPPGEEVPQILLLESPNQISRASLGSGRRFALFAPNLANDLFVSIAAAPGEQAGVNDIQNVYWGDRHVNSTNHEGQWEKGSHKPEDPVELTIAARKTKENAVLFIFVEMTTPSPDKDRAYVISVSSADSWVRLVDGAAPVDMTIPSEGTRNFFLEVTESSPHVVFQAEIPFDQDSYVASDSDDGKKTAVGIGAGNVFLFVSGCGYLNPGGVQPDSPGFWISAPDSERNDAVGSFNTRGQLAAIVPNSISKVDNVPCYYKASIKNDRPRAIRARIRGLSTSVSTPASIGDNEAINSVVQSNFVELYRLVAPDSVDDVVVIFEPCDSEAVMRTSEDLQRVKTAPTEEEKKGDDVLDHKRHVSKFLKADDATFFGVHKTGEDSSSSEYFLSVHSASTFECLRGRPGEALRADRKKEKEASIEWDHIHSFSPSKAALEKGSSEDDIRRFGVCTPAQMESESATKVRDGDVMYEIFWEKQEEDSDMTHWSSSCGLRKRHQTGHAERKLVFGGTTDFTIPELDPASSYLVNVMAIFPRLHRAVAYSPQKIPAWNPVSEPTNPFVPVPSGHSDSQGSSAGKGGKEHLAPWRLALIVIGSLFGVVLLYYIGVFVAKRWRDSQSVYDTYSQAAGSSRRTGGSWWGGRSGHRSSGIQPFGGRTIELSAFSRASRGGGLSGENDRIYTPPDAPSSSASSAGGASGVPMGKKFGRSSYERIPQGDGEAEGGSSPSGSPTR